MSSCSLNKTAGDYACDVVMLDATQSVIRCRHNLQWLFQRRTSADLNKGHWVGLSYHTSWESLTARYSGVREALNAGLQPNTAPKDEVVLDDQDGQG